MSLRHCDILPPKTSLDKNLKLKTLEILDCKGDEFVLTKVLTSTPMEKLDLRSEKDMTGPISNYKFRNFVENLPNTGHQLKSLHLGWNHLPSSYDFQFDLIKPIVDNCSILEELFLGY